VHLLQVESSTSNGEEESNWAADERLSSRLVDWGWLGGGGRVVGWRWLGDDGGGGHGSVLASDDRGDGGWGGRAGGGGRLWLIGRLSVGLDSEKTSVVDLSGLVIPDLESVVVSRNEILHYPPGELSGVWNVSCRYALVNRFCKFRWSDHSVNSCGFFGDRLLLL
jgi:hypothetical protein